MSFFSELFSDLKKYRGIVKRINLLEKEISSLTDEQMLKKSLDLKETISKNPETISDFVADGFALVRESAKRNLNQRHFDVQLMGGLAIFDGGISEMATGEGKTLAATAPAYLRALSGKGIHIITVNDYLAQRDAVWMGQVYNFLGLKTSCITHDSSFVYDPNWHIVEEGDQLIDKERDATGSFKVQKEYLRPVSRKEAYEADIVYGTNHEFGFDYLRDNLAYDKSAQVQRGYYFAIIDEVDSILIDEARTPLIISAPDTQAAEYYKLFANVVSRLEKEKDYEVDEKQRAVKINDDGIQKVEKMIGVENLYDSQNIRLVHYLEESLRARALFFKDRHYIIKNGEAIIVDEFTGRLMPGRRYSGGLHQAIEAKENIHVQEESKTFAQITIQNYFRLYEKISGMTGTAKTSEEEFKKVYGLKVTSIPTNKPRIRNDLKDWIFKNKEAKYQAIVKEVKERSQKGQPILLGTTSIDENEILSQRLSAVGISHEVLNAKNHEREAEIIAQAGKPGSVTLATNMAGRGVDIILGGNPKNDLESEKVKQAGGLFVLGTQRNEARRIDNQLRGRSGRQGDPGETKFFLSLEDDLLRIFGGDRVRGLMERFNLPDDMPIDSSLVSRVVDEAQKKVEGLNFDARKHLLEYDDVLNRQRKAVYRKRQNILEKIKENQVREALGEMILNSIDFINQSRLMSENQEEGGSILKKFLIDANLLKTEDSITEEDIINFRENGFSKEIDEKIEKAINSNQAGVRILAYLDMFWTNHLENLEALMEAVRMRAYGQKDPLVEYKRESYDLFRNLISNAEINVVLNVFKDTENIPKVEVSAPKDDKEKGIGRNDPCWCGSGKKYKKCHGK